MTITAQTIADAEAVLEAARAEHAVTMAKVTAAYDVVQALRKAETDNILTGRTPAEFWADPVLREFVIQRDWNEGYGDRDAERFIADAIQNLSPGDFYEYERFTSSDDTTVVRIAPRIKMTYQQDIDAAHTALLTMLPVLSAPNATGEGEPFLLVEVFEHTCSQFGSIQMKVYSADQVVITRRGHQEYTGNLADMLTRIASDFWYDGGPRSYDEDIRDW